MKVDKELKYHISINAARVNTLLQLRLADTTKFVALIGYPFPRCKSSDITEKNQKQRLSDEKTSFFGGRY